MTEPSANPTANAAPQPPGYRLLGDDNYCYGPLNLATLRQCFEEKRANAATWVFDETAARWLRAEELHVLRDLFPALPANEPNPSHLALRRVKALAGFSPQELEQFSRYVTAQSHGINVPIVSAQQVGDAMFLIAEGVVRVVQRAGTQAIELARLEAGDHFGEICLFDQGIRTADVISNTEVKLFRLNAVDFGRMSREHEATALHFLIGLMKSEAARLRKTNKRYLDSVQLLHAVNPVDK